jgi:hypothetical protein
MVGAEVGEHVLNIKRGQPVQKMVGAGVSN